ncbi:E3 ubiquitin-protein ligase makorin-like isoform X1 [Silene latifolia]|uniref:E3 ubiquitin-protein ligase makorin-like isoform X1 n=2 Tax=Silene latifolia TaxID=37657 RepID=UPI003D77E664
MSNSDRVLCKFFAHGACLKGENCEYAHDWTAPPNNICKYYQQGACAYGARCRYDHVKPVKVFRAESPASSSSAASVVTTIDRSPVYSVQKELSSTATSRLLPSRSKQAWILQLEDPDTSNDDVFPKPRGHDPDGQVLCSFAAAGHCPKGDKCPHVHGDLCLSCGKHCLHPARPKEREEHSKTCAKMQKHLESLRRSQEIECSVCLERVLLKPKEKDRRFGILCECDHPFCISCIRVWRGSSPSSGMDINSTLRACPICRKLSYFVIPSVIWYFSQEEKEDIVNSYKGKLKSIDCKHFDFGNGSCPFGISCFYKHAYHDGTLEEVVLRHLTTADGESFIPKQIRLGDIFSNIRIS